MQERGQVIEGFRLSMQQQRVWRLQQESRAYNSQCLIQIEGYLDSEALEAALRQMMRRHEAMRMALDWLPGLETPIQLILDHPPLPFRKVDLSGKGPEMIETAVDELRREEARPFDLKRGLLARFCLARLPESRHVLLVSFHALCADGRTLRNLFKEISRLYAAELEGKELAGEPAQYLQFSEWQHASLEEEGWESANRESGRSVPNLALPLEFTSAGTVEISDSRFSPQSIELTLDPRTAERIEAVSRDRPAAVSGFLQACWQILLWRLTGEEAILTECLFDGRPFDELQDAFGLFARYAPVEGTLGRDLRFGETVERAMRQLRDTSASLELSLHHPIIGKTGERAGAIGYEYEEWPAPVIAGAASFSYRLQSSLIDRFKLKLAAHRKHDGLSLQFQYDASRFSRQSVTLLAERFQTLIESAISDPSALISDLEIIGPQERHQLLAAWNETQRALPDESLLPARISQQARSRPESVAVICGDQSLTFGELERRSNQLAHYLKRLGVGAESVVGLFLERSNEMVIGLVGILKAGGAYLPIDVRQPASRVSMMLEDAGAGVIVSREEESERLPESGARVVRVDRDREVMAGESSMAPEPEVSGENLAYVIYTSGSSGKPKGVMVRHGSVINLLEGLKRDIYEGEGEYLTVSVNAPLSFDASVKQIIQLGSGHRLCLVPEDERMEAEAMLEYLRSRGVEALDSTPSQIRMLMEAGLGREARDPKLALVGGEAIDERSWREMSEARTVRYRNVYGPTECTVDATSCEVREGEEPSIGRPINNTRIYILDEMGRLAPTGVEGEICIGGAGVTRGYRGEAGMTAERYVPNPYEENEGERIYRTGDQGRYDEDGRIVYVGRRDRQVKIRGYRIELGEIEQALRSHRGVREAVVKEREDEPGERRLVGYVVGRREERIEGRKRRRLPNGMRVVEQNRNETDYLYEEIYGKKSYMRHGIRVPEGGCVFDVGANIGLFTLFVKQNRRGARVYAFEPIGPIYETLRINTELYGGEGVKLYQVGMGEKEGKEWYTYYRGYSMMSGESRYAASEEDREVIKRYLRNEGVEREELVKEADEILERRFEEERYECEVRRLSEVIREERIGRIDLLKVDVQRAEREVLRGLEEEDWKKIEQVVMEVHDQEGGESEGRAEEMRRELEERGYRVVIEQEELLKGTDRYNLYARREREEEREEERWEECKEEEENEEISEEELKRYVSERAPWYMAPAAIVVMEEFPLTRNGKVDLEGLPRPEEMKREGEEEEAGELNAYEEIIRGIWKEVLKVERVGRRENFFEKGGHSLLATQVISRVRQAFGVEIGVRSIFEEGTVEGLGRRVEEEVSRREKRGAPPLVRASREGQGDGSNGVRMPLSFAQQRLWFLDQLVPNNPLYNCPAVVRLEGRLDLEAMERVLNEIVRRHEVLRTRFEIADGEPVQVIDPWAPRRLEVEDLTGLPDSQRMQAAAGIIREEVATGFDLSRGPLMRARILKLDSERRIALFITHHIVSDGWSMGVLIKEIGLLYQAFRAEAASPLEELPIQYADFAVWQREWLKGEALEEELEYWRRQLSGVEVLELPADHPRPAAPSYRGSRRRFALERELAERLRALSQREGVTLFMTLLAAFDIVMSRYSGQEDVATGTDIANRNRAETEGLIGFFVNQLVMRVRVNASERFSELLKQVRAVCLGAYAHQDLPFEKLVEELQPERDLSRSPLFQAKLVLQHSSIEKFELEGLRVSGGEGDEMQAGGAETARFDLTVAIKDEGRDLIGVVEYSRDLFEERTIERLMSHFVNILNGIVEDSESPISQLSMLSDSEREQIVVEWNQTERPYPRGRCIHELFAAQAERTPERIALAGAGQRLSYGELDRRANRLGHYLRKLGAGPEVVVGVCLERSVEMVMAVLGALKAGAAYLPLDPEYPLERLSYMLEDAGVGVLLTQQDLESRLPAFGGRTVCLDVEWEKIDRLSEIEPESGVISENVAYVIYTSGSTGRPKGVMVRHEGVANLVEAQKTAFGLDDRSGVLQFSSWSFDASVWETFSTLATGGRLHLYPQRSVMPGEELAGVLRDDLITMVTLPPSALSVMAPESLDQLQTIIAAGEACPVEIVERWAGGRRFFDAYGPTEATVCASMDECQAGSGVKPSIGRPIANTKLYLLDREMQPAPVGAQGELYISGVGLARGYLGRPELTAERFIPDPFSTEEGGRLYRTGDVGRYLSNGKIDFAGRADEQVKIRGYRIELGEIETALNEHRSVRQSVVMAREDDRGGKRLVAFVVGEEAASAPEIKKHIRERLPEYMVPESITMLEEMPVTANGKVDRRRLLTLNEAPQSSERFVPPRDALELRLVKIWENVLGIQPIGVRDNFFELGGHSLLAASLMARMREAAGRDLPLSALFQGGTIEHLAAIMRPEAGSMAWPCLVEIQASGSKPPLFLVHPGGGDVVCYLELARCLGSDQPVYGLRSPGFYGELTPYARVEEMAAHYLEALKTVQPEGPYLLGGWSLGGAIAYEMAQQLVAHGERVSQLLLLDSTAWSALEKHVGEEHLEEDDAALLINLLAEELPIETTELREIPEDQRMDYLLKQAADLNLLPPDLGVGQVSAFLKMYRANVRAGRKYVPRTYPGAVTLFKTSKEFTRVSPEELAGGDYVMKMIQDPTRGWGDLATGGVQVIDAPGQHATMMSSPYVETLASQIRNQLDSIPRATQKKPIISLGSRSTSP